MFDAFDYAFARAASEESEGQRGLTKREIFAMAAMQGACADPHMTDCYDIAAFAVGCADALIAELNKPEKE
jgi:hypothetical protein